MEQRGISAHGIHKRFGGAPVLSGARLEAAPGSAVALVGENGSGKTTLLRICAGLLRPDGAGSASRGGSGTARKSPG